jgi:hypothetical protein
MSNLIKRHKYTTKGLLRYLKRTNYYRLRFGLSNTYTGTNRTSSKPKEWHHQPPYIQSQCARASNTVQHTDDESYAFEEQFQEY